MPTLPPPPPPNEASVGFQGLLYCFHLNLKALLKRRLRARMKVTSVFLHIDNINLIHMT